METNDKPARRKQTDKGKTETTEPARERARNQKCYRKGWAAISDKIRPAGSQYPALEDGWCKTQKRKAGKAVFSMELPSLISELLDARARCQVISVRFLLLAVMLCNRTDTRPAAHIHSPTSLHQRGYGALLIHKWFCTAHHFIFKTKVKRHSRHAALMSCMDIFSSPSFLWQKYKFCKFKINKRSNDFH